MKKFLCVTLCLTMIFAISATAFAAYDEPQVSSEEYIFEPTPDYTDEEISELLKNSPDAVTYSEYDLFLQRQNEAKQVLKSPRSTAAEKVKAEQILSENLYDEVYELQKATDAELQDRGFEPDRINIIRNFNGTSAELQALAAKCTVSGTPKYTNNASGRWAKITFYFQWDKSPIYNSRDAMVAGSSAGFLVQNVVDSKCSINYKGTKNGTTGSYTNTYNYNSLKANPFSGGLIAGFSYPAIENRVISGTDYICYSVSGSAVIVFKSVDTKQVSLSYGNAHAKKSISPNVGISFASSGISGGLGFGLSDGYDVVAKVCNSYTF